MEDSGDLLLRLLELKLQLIHNRAGTATTGVLQLWAVLPVLRPTVSH